MRISAARLRYCTILVFLSALGAPLPARAQSIDTALDIMERMQRAMDSITDYTCLFGKRELIGNEIHEEDSILLKVKKPGHFFMKWTCGPNKGRRVIYVHGKSNNKMVVHLTGLLSFLPISIDPAGKKAMHNNRHPITEAGVGYIIDLCAKDCRRSVQDSSNAVITVSAIGDDSLEISGTFPSGKGYYTHKVHVIVDKRLWLPVKITCFGWNDEFIEEYRFDDIKINVGLIEKDFEIDEN